MELMNADDLSKVSPGDLSSSQETPDISEAPTCSAFRPPVLVLTFPLSSLSPVLGLHQNPEDPAQHLPSFPGELTWAVEDLRDCGKAFGPGGLQGLVDTGKVFGVGEESLQAFLGFSSSPYNKQQRQGATAGGVENHHWGPGLRDQAAMGGIPYHQSQKCLGR